MMDADTLRLLSPVNDDARNGSKTQRLSTIFWAMVQKIFAVLLVIAVYVLPHVCRRLKCNYPLSSIVVYLHIGTYVIQLSIHCIIEREHSKHRQLGYLKFYEETKLVRRAPSFIFCAGTLALLLMQTILIGEGDRLAFSRGPEGHAWPLAWTKLTLFGLSLTHEDFYSILVTVQVLLVVPFIISYIVKVVKFHSQLPPPDVYLEEEVLTSYMRAQTNAEVGVRERSQLDALLSKQADKIQYLEDHNRRLGQKLLELTQRIGGNSASAVNC